MCPLEGGLPPGGSVNWLLQRQHKLVNLLFMCLLVSNILAHCCLIESYGTHTVTPCPKVIACQIFTFAKVTAVDQDRGLAFQPPYRLSYCIPRRNTQAHMNMVWLSVPLHQFYTKLGA